MKFPLTITSPLPHPSPFELYKRIASPTQPSFLLESGRQGSGHARYSFLGSDPYLVLSGKGNEYEIRTPQSVTRAFGNALHALRNLLHPSLIPRSSTLPPFIGGAVGWFSYDLVRQLECLPTLATDDLHLPDFEFLFVDLSIAIDHNTDRLHIMFTPSPERLLSESHTTLAREGKERLEALHHKLRTPQKQQDIPCSPLPSPAAIHAYLSRSDYVQRVQQCQSFIHAGDIYQANLSHRFSIDWETRAGHSSTATSQSLYQRLRLVNPSPFSGLLVTNTLSLVSSSPERLVCLQDNKATTRPIAGTRPRGRTEFEDQRLVQKLLLNTKERAEHLMLVDLARNDLGRVCQYGSIHVDEFMTVEQYSHVTHLVSYIRGILRPSLTGFDLLKAVFPGGTISGVPKIRCMEIIEQLEPIRRGPYTGSLGYFSWTGDIDFNILIRTILVVHHRAYIQVGAGIVVDSHPDLEYEETMQKAQALFQALR